MKKAKRGTFLGDTFEQLEDLGKSTAKKTGETLTQTFSPLNLAEFFTGAPVDIDQNKDAEKKPKNGDKSTTLDITKLQEKYKGQDEVKEKALRNRLFQLVKEGEREVLVDERREDQDKKQREAVEKRERTEQEEKRRKREASDIPQGKVRRSIFSPKKVARRQHAEVRPSSGKQ